MSDDRDLSSADIQMLANSDSVVSFFAHLGYDTDTRLPQTPAAMGITAESLQGQIQRIERVAVQDDGAEPLDIYLIELSSVTVAATQGLARALRNRAGNYLLVLTDDYERLDFVLLERALPASPTTAMGTRQVSVRPHILTVNRRNPSTVHLRVLRRFTYTEADSDAQYDKLLSAYTVAEWSEPLFNNRALFSDYYLNERLPERPEWHERPEATYHRLRELLFSARQRLSGQPASATRQLLLEPALEALGFNAVPESAGTDTAKPHYWLYSTEAQDKSVAVCLAYIWNRNLDGRDETRDVEAADENPGARVVALLDSGEAPWAIVTNGKLWRLYSARAHSRATNYFEIDLDETLAMSDPNVAFRYFWLLFRATAFIPQSVVRDGQTRRLSFLEELVEDSESYAKGLGERLKHRVFEEIFPHIAEGFIEHLKAQPPLTGAQQGTLIPIAQQLALKQEPDEGFRRQVFQGTLTFLYRLLFLLYAESRGLLPVKEVRGYWEHSLTRMKEEIAAKAGDILDEAPTRLRKAYSANSTTLYDRLLKLFAVVDRGSRDLNVPLYNGGLFITTPESIDQSSEVENARFLLAHKIPDRYLALGLDRLARDIDEKRQSLVFIDYKSMGVRQLGSIYEGLLEFKIRIAPEKMAVVQGKKTAEVIPYREAIKTKRKVLIKGRGRNAEERVYRPGDVYLENDRRERRATGSYYTPDHIVKYIVEHTVGPVLEERFAKLRAKFREAQQAYRNARKRNETLLKQGLKPEDPAKVANTYCHLVDELFDLRVLDPAMGSGHFLVEAVDFVCDRILGQQDGFLQAFPWNPVTAFLDETRRAILTEMERQGVSIDTGRLTDINLLKRHVLKRCIYGADLNPMAVELAKVSLWLDCFTLGAPLSFMDHHLKAGNSLIGTTVQEVEAELAAQKKGHVGDLFGGPFQGLLSATAMIEELRRIPDATVEQAERSRGLFSEFEKAQAPYKAALDIWVSRYFGNARAQEYLTLVGREYVEEIRSGGRGLSPEYRGVIARAAEMSRDKRFFHWDLEFPEAFVDLDRKTWKPEGEQGFDAVVGNPPYDELTEYSGHDPLLTEFLRSIPAYSDALGGRLNVFRPFVLRSTSLLHSRGRHSFIVPMSLLGDEFTRRLRSRLLRQGQLRSVVAFPQKDDPHNRVFPEAKLSTCVYVLQKTQDVHHLITIRTFPGRSFDDLPKECFLRVSDIENLDANNLSIPPVSSTDIDRWRAIVASPKVTTWRIVAPCYLGELMSNAVNSHLFSKEPVGPRLVKGAHINRYLLLPEAKQGVDLYLREEAYLKQYALDKRSSHHRWMRVGFQQSSPIDNWRRLIACIIPPGHYCKETVQYFSVDSKYHLFAILALFNSDATEWRFQLVSTNNHVNAYQINDLPIPRFERLKYSQPAKNANWAQWEGSLQFSEGVHAVPWEKEVAQIMSSVSRSADAWPDKVHDALAAAGRELTRLNEDWLKLKSGAKVTGMETRLRKNRQDFQSIDEAVNRVVWQLLGLGPDGGVV